MKKLISLFALGVCLCVLAGCEWTAGGGVESWDDSGNWVDFSGTYKANDGGVLVRKYGETNAIHHYATNTVAGELLAVGDGTNTAFSGTLAHTPTRGSLTIFTVGGYRFMDISGATSDTVPLPVTPADGSTGLFNFSTRAWALTFPAPIADGTAIRADYQYTDMEEVVNPIQGNHGNAIYSFVVYQTGNKIQLVDSNGTRYEGALGTVRTTGGRVIDASDPTTLLPEEASPVTAQFSATGISQGFRATIVGVFGGIFANNTILANRTMQATFIEDSGYEADVSAVAGN